MRVGLIDGCSSPVVEMAISIQEARTLAPCLIEFVLPLMTRNMVKHSTMSKRKEWKYVARKRVAFTVNKTYRRHGRGLFKNGSVQICCALSHAWPV